MKKHENICHEGIVISVDGNNAIVKITMGSACAACAVKKSCGMSETEDREVAVTIDEGMNLNPGDQVEVYMTKDQGLKAVVLSYVIPFIIIVGTLTALLIIGTDELFSVAISLILGGGYYFLIYKLRGDIERKFEFHVIKKQD